MVDTNFFCTYIHTYTHTHIHTYRHLSNFDFFWVPGTPKPLKKLKTRGPIFTRKHYFLHIWEKVTPYLGESNMRCLECSLFCYFYITLEKGSLPANVPHNSNKTLKQMMYKIRLYRRSKVFDVFGSGVSIIKDWSFLKAYPKISARNLNCNSLDF